MSGGRTLTRRGRRLAPLLGLLLLLVLAGFLWRSAFSSEPVESTLVGNARATVVRTETTRNTSLLVGAVALTSLGFGIVGALFTASRSRAVSRRRTWGIGATVAMIVAALATGAIVATRSSPRAAPSRGALSHTDFRTTAGFVTAMEAAGLGCAEKRPAHLGRGAVDSIVCSVPWDADIRDGHDDVVVTVWRSGDERDRWLDRDVEQDTPAVVGSAWGATCEFRSTCALIAHRLRSTEGG
jgi:hypothetical protein